MTDEARGTVQTDCAGMSAGKKTSVIFDFGGVLIDWNPRHLYRKVFQEAQAMEDFLATVCTNDWQEMQNETRTWAEAVAERVALFPEHRPLIEMYRSRWLEMIRDADWETVAIVDALRQRGLRLYGLTNWSAEMFPPTRRRFDFIDWFEGVVVSGEVGIRKPSPEIFRHLFSRYRVDPNEAVFIDDKAENLAVARSLRLESHHFTSAANLRTDLEASGLL